VIGFIGFLLKSSTRFPCFNPAISSRLNGVVLALEVIAQAAASLSSSMYRGNLLALRTDQEEVSVHDRDRGVPCRSTSEDESLI
jgi:hypothetical protein